MVLIFLPDLQRDPGAPEMSMDLNIRYLFVVPYLLWSKEPRLHGLQPLKFPVDNVIISWTEQEECETEGECVRALWELQKKYHAMGQEIPYNFVVGGDSTVYECRGWRASPTPCKRHPDLVGSTFEIAHVGIRDHTGRSLTAGMIKAACDVVDYGMNKGYIVGNPTYLPDYDMFYGADITEEQKKDLLEWELDEEVKKPFKDSSDIPDMFN